MDITGIIIDVVIVSLLMYFMLRGAKKGFVKSLVELSSGLVALIAAFAFRDWVAVYLSKFKFISDVRDSIAEKLALDATSSASLENARLPKWLSDVLGEKIETASEMFADKITEIVLAVLSVFLIYLVVRLLFIALNFLVDKIKIKGIHRFNSLLGGCMGLINALIIVYMVMLVVFFAATFDLNSGLNEIIQSTLIGAMFYNNNIIMKLIF